MDDFKCTYENHENDKIIGFCLNQKCQNTTKFCLKCLIDIHQDHQKDCIPFHRMIEFVNKPRQNLNELQTKFIKISEKLEKSFQQFFKTIDQEAIILENMDNILKDQDYSTFNEYIHILKQFYSKEKYNYICIFYIYKKRIKNKKTNSIKLQNNIRIRRNSTWQK
ncbi:unnamed protein product (macronuclear) [Paramecium tetraurelia]|uniref:B box-type domain-containing protein n=1 Tax=Paramecium tetraurelia TaxID=5888 RepID=A0E6V7_PARTE|nr:uncharacterized protein GSPATT00023752001 [Paramecium tetraurelia]CAK91024.1 unnamed protein product [Paramecium tetraurelia]|eukprot:XP_001458421.1 hypothetical protein (macronuclear) [Paramecium tetraurelia strain d4-2]